jgi:hypothetical protein
MKRLSIFTASFGPIFFYRLKKKQTPGGVIFQCLIVYGIYNYVIITVSYGFNACQMFIGIIVAIRFL